MTLSDLLKSLEQEPLNLDYAYDFTHPKIEEALEANENHYELRKLIHPKMVALLDKAAQLYSQKLSAETGEEKELAKIDLEKILVTKERFEKGGVVTIDGLSFYNPLNCTIPQKTYYMNPAFNTVSSALLWGGFVTMLASLPMYFFDKELARQMTMVSNVGVVGGFGLKFLNKAYKQFRSEKENPKGVALNLTSGLGALLAADPTQTGLALTGMAGTAYYWVAMLNLYTKFFKFLFKRERVKEPLPPLNVIKEDLIKQIESYNKIKKNYEGAQFRILKKEDFSSEANFVNKFIKYHLETIKLDDIDIDLDAVTGRVLGATARADVFTQTSEFSSEKIAGVDAPLFAKVYAHEISHLDGVVNEGRANYRADKVLEDMAIILPGQGYDLQLEKDKLISVGHSYTLALGAAYRHEMPPQKMVKHFQELGLHPEQVSEEAKRGKKNQINKNYCPLTSILGWTYNNKGGRKLLFGLQSLVGGSNPNSGYTIDNYKLMKRHKML